MKKIYEKPEMQVCELITESSILVTSNPGISPIELGDEEEWD